MINADDLHTIINVLELHLVGYSNDEITAYSQGSYFKPNKFRIGTSYLELYLFILNRVVGLLDLNLNYTDYGFTNDGVYAIIDKSNELMFYYGD